MALYGIVLPKKIAQQIALYKTGKSIHQGTEKSFTDMPRVIFPSTSRAWAHGGTSGTAGFAGWMWMDFKENQSLEGTSGGLPPDMLFSNVF